MTFGSVSSKDVAGISGVAPPPKFFHPFGVLLYGLISAKDVSCIHFIDYIVEAGVIAICYDGLT